MINLFIMILQVLASYTENECNICAWPYYGTANRRGECVLGVGLQANLQNTCTNWCLTEMGPSTVPPVASFDPNGSCICQSATTSGGPITYKARPRKSCDKWGPSDDYIASNSSSAYSIKSSQISSDEDKYYESQSTNDNVFSSSMSYARGTMDQSYVNEFYQVTNPVNGTIRFTAGNNPSLGVTKTSLSLDLSGITSRIGMSQDLLLRSLNASATARSYSTDSLLQIIDSSVNQLSNTTSGFLTNSDFMQAKQDILYAINSRVGSGGGEPTDLTGVMTALSALSVQSTSNTDRILSALDSLNNGTDSTGWDLAGVEALIAEATNNTKRQTDTISAIDRRKWDKDAKSAAAIDSINARGKLTESQISQINGFGTEADALSLSGETEKQGLLAAILDFKSNISTTCSDGTITGMDVDVHAGDERLHTKMDFTIQLNSYFNDPNHQKAFALLRIFARIAGLTGAIMVAFFSSAMLLRVGSQINQRWKI